MLWPGGLVPAKELPMPCRLTCEEVVSIQVLSTKQVPKRQIARQRYVRCREWPVPVTDRIELMVG